MKRAKSILQAKDFDFYGDLIEYQSKQIKIKSGQLRIKAAHFLERSEAILAKYLLH